MHLLNHFCQQLAALKPHVSQQHVTSSQSKSTYKVQHYSAAWHKAIQHLQVLNVHCWCFLPHNSHSQFPFFPCRLRCIRENYDLSLYGIFIHRLLFSQCSPSTDIILSRVLVGCEEPVSADWSSLCQGGGVKIPAQISQSVLGHVASEPEGKSVHVQSSRAARRSDLYVHRPDLSSLILLHPQLSVSGRVHALQQLVHWLHRLDKERTVEASV